MAATKELLVQIQINRSNAIAGGRGATVMASAMISVQVTQNGIPVDNLGATVGDGSSEVALPVGWNLFEGFNVRPGGSGVSVTQFVNCGLGVYDIRIVPYLANPACAWLSGEYLYSVNIQVRRTISRRAVDLRGSALGKLTIL